MKKLIIGGLLIAAFSSLRAQNSDIERLNSFGGTGSDRTMAVTTDFQGNIYTAGSFSGTSDLDPGEGTSEYTAVGSADMYVSKQDNNGDLIWAQQIGTIRGDEANDVQVDNQGNVYVAGFISDDLEINGVVHDNVGHRDMFVAKLNSNGDILWYKALGNAGFNEATSLGFDAAGNVYVTGSFWGVLDFDLGPGINNLSSPGGSADVFIWKLNSNGDFIWANKIGDISIDRGYDISVLNDGTFYIGGEYSRSPDFDPGTEVFRFPYTPYVNPAFICKYSADCDLIWGRNFAEKGGCKVMGVNVDVDGNILATGHFSNTIDFDPLTESGSLYGGRRDGFIVKHNSNGDFQWVTQITGDLEIESLDITTDNSGNVFTTGWFIGTADFDHSSEKFELTAIGQYDAFITALSKDGEFAWAKSIGSTAVDQGRSVTVDKDDNLMATGFFRGTPTFLPEAPVGNLVSLGNYDGYTIKFGEIQFPPVKLPSVSIPCSEDEFVQAINTSTQIPENAIALDFDINYNAAILNPKSATVGGAGNGFGTVFLSKPTTGVAHVSIFLSQAAQGTAILPGDELISLEWEVLEGADLNTQYPITLSNMLVSFPVGATQMIAPRAADFNLDSEYFIELFTEGGKKISFNEEDPSLYLVTNIYGMDENCTEVVSQTTPNTSAKARLAGNDVSFIKIERDIIGDQNTAPENCTVVTAEINSADVNNILLIINGVVSASPLEMLAADVNLDGMITAGDAALITSRSINEYGCEFPQVHNYTSAGVPNIFNYTPSKDWLFVSDEVAATYNFDRLSIPSVDDCQPTPASCDATASRYHGVMLGDVNGSWRTADGLEGLKTAEEIGVSLKLSAVDTLENSYVIPVILDSWDFTYGVDMSIDLSTVGFDINQVISVENVTTNWNKVGNNILIQSYEYQGLEIGTVIFYLEVSKEVDLASVEGSLQSASHVYLNGEPANVKLTTATSSSEVIESPIMLYPQPAKDQLKVAWPYLESGVVAVVVTDMFGRELLSQNLEVSLSTLSIVDISGLNQGAYFFEVILTDGSKYVNRFIKN